MNRTTSTGLVIGAINGMGSRGDPNMKINGLLRDINETLKKTNNILEELLKQLVYMEVGGRQS
jgi:hypothetical protein